MERVCFLLQVRHERVIRGADHALVRLEEVFHLA
jgi:hypothetical protein